MIYSAINYMGSKRRLLDQIKPLLPKNINTFYDLFAGSLIVDLNVLAKHYVVNDLNNKMIELFEYLNSLSDSETQQLALDSHCLVDNNIFYQTRQHYNEQPNPRDLYLLITNSFNGIPRWNKKGEYNMPFASKTRLRDSYYQSKKKKLFECVNQLHKMSIQMTSKSYEQVINFNELQKDDLVYLDPPYFGTDATYNKQTSWNANQEQKIYNFLSKLIQNNVNFAYSNVLTHRDNTNPYLQEFIEQHKKQINVHHLNMNYSHSTYHTKKGTSDEILITNY